MPGRFLSLFKPITKLLPEVKTPEGRVRLSEKFLWTGIVLVIYFIMTQIPIYGAQYSGNDPYYALRVIFASSRGSLMELGIQPIVTAGLITQLFSSSGLVSFDKSNPEDRALLAGITKLFSIAMTGFLAIAYLVGGAYGTGLSFETSLIIFLQLFVVGIIIVLFDELLQKGWGFGSAISLFIAAGVALKILWDTFCPLPYESDGKSLGSLIAYVQALFKGENPISAFFSRSDPNAPTMIGLIVTISIFLLVIYLQSLKVELPISYARVRGYRGRYPIKLLYVSTIPVVLVSALFMDLYFVAQIASSRFNPDGTNMWINILGRFEGNELKGGVAYFLTSPQSITQFLADPIRGLVFAGLMIGACVVFALLWLELGGLGPSSVAQQLMDSGLQIPGFRRSTKPIQNILSKYIPTVTVVGAILVGAIASFSNFLGVYGSGIGILLTVGIMAQYYEMISKDQMLEMYPMLGRLLGK
jgi:preprotein translocase SecY subunit